MGDFSMVDGGDEPIGDGVDRLIKVGLGREDVDRSLWRYWDIVGGEGRDVGGAGDRVEWDWKAR
jgi:hypothetical protein